MFNIFNLIMQLGGQVSWETGAFHMQVIRIY